MAGLGVGVPGKWESGASYEIRLDAFQYSAWDMDAVSSPTCTTLISPRYEVLGTDYLSSGPFLGGHYQESKAERIPLGIPRSSASMFLWSHAVEACNNIIMIVGSVLHPFYR